MAKQILRAPSLLEGRRRKAVSLKEDGGRAPKLRRAEKSETNRRELIRAAVDVIGQYGYDGASISRITERAGLAQGTFYIYFDSRQELFDIVLPELTTELLDHVAQQVHGATDFFELEEKGVTAFFDVVLRNPGLFRIINEAQVAAPVAFRKHIDELIGRYVSSMRRALEKGDLRDVDEGGLREIAHMLIGARNYLFLAYETAPVRGRSIEHFVASYMRLVRSVLGNSTAPPRRGAAAAAKKVVASTRERRPAQTK